VPRIAHLPTTALRYSPTGRLRLGSHGLRVGSAPRKHGAFMLEPAACIRGLGLRSAGWIFTVSESEIHVVVKARWLCHASAINASAPLNTGQTSKGNGSTCFLGTRHSNHTQHPQSTRRHSIHESSSIQPPRNAAAHTHLVMSSCVTSDATPKMACWKLAVLNPSHGPS